MRWQCIVLIVIVSSFSDCSGQDFNWTRCEPDELKDDLFVHELLISPLPVHLPGALKISFDAVIGREAPELLIDIRVGVKNLTSGEIEAVYPVDTEYMRIYEGCLVINELLFNDFARISSLVDIQIDQMYTDAVGYHVGCPLLEGRITFDKQPIRLPMDFIEMNALQKGRYVVGIEFKSRENDSEVLLGCVETQVDYVGQIID